MTRRLALFLVLGCGGSLADDGETSSTTGETTSTSTSASTTSADGSESSGGEESTGEPPGSTTTGGLPDYSDSPCWGQPGETIVYNGVTHATAPVDVTCRAEGDRTLLYVQDELWGTQIDQDLVNRFMHRFEIFTPEGSYNPEQGVIVNNEEVFGDLPDGKVEIYVVNTEGGGDGYLCGWCSSPVLHLDGVILDPIDGDFPVSIAAHESYHLIHHAIDADETVWVDESLAEAAMTANGFFTDLDWLDDFMANPDQNWGPAAAGFGEFNYGAGLLWGTLLYERGGVDLMRAITAESANDWEGLDAALATVGDDKTAWELYQDLMVAIYIDRPEAGYGFEFFDVEDVAREGDLGPSAMVSGGLNPYGIDYWRFAATGSLTVTVTGSQPITALAVVSGDDVVVTPVGTDTVVDIDPAADDAFLVLTAEATATYDITVG